MSHFYEYMAEHYDILAPGLAGDVDFHVGLAREAVPMGTAKGGNSCWKVNL